MLQLGLHLRANPHQLVAMDQQLPQILLFPGRSPDPRKPSSSSNFKISAASRRSCFCCRTSAARIFAASPIHTSCPSARPSPQTTDSSRSTPSRSEQAQAIHGKTSPLLPTHAPISFLRSRQFTVSSQQICCQLGVITSNNHHRRLLPTEFASVLQPEAYSATERSLRSIQSTLRVWFCKGGSLLCLTSPPVSR